MQQQLTRQRKSMMTVNVLEKTVLCYLKLEWTAHKTKKQHNMTEGTDGREKTVEKLIIPKISTWLKCTQCTGRKQQNIENSSMNMHQNRASVNKNANKTNTKKFKQKKENEHDFVCRGVDTVISKNKNE